MKIFGIILYLFSGLLMLIFWIQAMIHWLGGFLGWTLGLVFSSGLVIFPLIYWIVEGIFPAEYFFYWGIWNNYQFDF